MTMRGTLRISLLGAGLLLAAGGAAAEYRCGVYPERRLGLADREYRSCGECLRDHDRCEERCAEAGYVCTASGYDRRGRLQRVEGDVADRERQARRSAEERCQDERLTGCQAERCAEEAGQDQIRPCRQTAEDRLFRPRRPSRENRSGGPPAAPQPPYVVSWQHVKEQCQGRPYHKIAEQCGNRVPFWQGIRCQVTWSDGRSENIGGRADLTDPHGRSYCTRDTRPASFNCVSRCDDTPGPLISLPPRP